MSSHHQHPPHRIDRPGRLCLLCLLLLWLGSTILLSPCSAAVAPQPVLLRAEVALQNGDGKTAESVYKALHQAQPNAWQPMVGLAEVARRRLQYAQAEQWLKRALAKHPKQPQVWAELGHLYNHWQSGDWLPKGQPRPQALGLQAEQALKQAERLAPDHPLVLTYRAEALLNNNQPQAAQPLLSRLMSQSPDFVPGLQQAARFYMGQQDYTRTRGLLLKALELQPRNSATLYLMARLMQAVNRPSEALSFAERSANADFGVLPERDWLLAEEYTRLGDVAKALSTYRVLQAYTPMRADIQLRLSQLNQQLGQGGTSRQQLQNALDLNPELAKALLTQAQTQLREAANEQALLAFRRLVETRPGEREALHGLATLHYAQYRQRVANPTAVQQDLQQFELAGRAGSTVVGQPVEGEEAALLTLDELKLRTVLQQGLLPEQRQQLNQLASQGQFALAAGEAAFLLGDYGRAQQHWEGITRDSAQHYAMAADRLYYLGDLLTSETLYQRALAENPPEAASLQKALVRIRQTRQEAEHWVSEGDAKVDARQYQEAKAQYQKALEWDPQLVGAHMKLGEVWLKLKQPDKAYSHWQTAVGLQPGLLQSDKFKRRYQRLAKQVTR